MTTTPGLVAVALAVAAVLVLAARVAPELTSPARTPHASIPGRRRGRTWRRRRPSTPDEVAVAAWCERVAGGVRSGSSLTRAVVDAGHEPGSPFTHVGLAVRRGRSLAATFHDDAGDPATPTGLAGPVVATCAELGGPATLALERVSAVLLARAAERDERRTASAQARLSARVLTLVPVGVVGLLAVAEPSIRAVLTTRVGAFCVGAGAVLDAIGWWWMRRMIGATS